MLNVTCEINGQQIDISNSNAIEQAMFQGVVGKAIDVVKGALSEDEISEITIKVVGTSLDDLSLSIAGPDELKAKIKASLQPQGQ